MSIYEASTKKLIPKVLDGVNCTVFAYGATGAGKTHTMTGVQGDERLQGIIPRALRDVFAGVDAKRAAAEQDLAERLRKKDADGEASAASDGVSLSNAFAENDSEARADEWSVLVSYLEVYNEKIYDLLAPVPQGEGGGRSTPLEPREDPIQRVVKVAGLREIPVATATDVLRLIEEGSARRTTEGTAANAVSSRSHAVLQVRVACKKFLDAGRTRVSTGIMSLIDLAGSERASATNNRGARLNEGANINKSLLALANCINALAERASASANAGAGAAAGKRKRDAADAAGGAAKGKRRNRRCSVGGAMMMGMSSSSSLLSASSSSSSFSRSGGRVKYRDSKLTHLLKSSLEGNCHLVMVACVNPSHACFEESHNTLKYANRAKNIKIAPRKQVQAFSPTAAEKRERQEKMAATRERAAEKERRAALKQEAAREEKERRAAEKERRAADAAKRAKQKLDAKEQERQAGIKRREIIEARQKIKKEAWANNSINASSATNCSVNDTTVSMHFSQSSATSRGGSGGGGGGTSASDNNHNNSLNISNVSDISQTNINANLSLNVSFEGDSVEDIIIESDPDISEHEEEEDAENASTASSTLSMSTSSSSSSASSSSSDTSLMRKRPRRNPPQKPEDEGVSSMGGGDDAHVVAMHRISELEQMVATLQAEKNEMAFTISELRGKLAKQSVKKNTKKRRSISGTKRAFGTQIPSNRLKPVLSTSKATSSSSTSTSSSASVASSTGSSRRRKKIGADSNSDNPRKKRRHRRHSMIPRPAFTTSSK